MKFFKQAVRQNLEATYTLTLLSMAMSFDIVN